MFRALALCLLAPALGAQVVTEGVEITGPGRVGVEAAAVLTDGPGWSVNGPEGLVRVGVGWGAEVRVGLPDYRRAALELGETGFSDMSAGLGVGLPAPRGWLASAFATVTLPTTGGPASPLVVVAAERALERVTVAAQAEAVWDREADRLETGGAALASLALAGPVRGFVEIAGATTRDGWAAVLGHGYVASVTPTLDVDLRLGAGLTATAPRAFVGVGAAAVF